MKKSVLFIIFICVAMLLSACIVKPLPPRQTGDPLPTDTPEPTSILTPEPTPEFDVNTVQQLIYAAGSVIGWEYAEEFDASRGLEVDRYFAEAFLYEFLNYELYDINIQAEFDEETYMNVMRAEDMLYLLRQYIGDYPALIQPPAELFLFMTDAGDYTYGNSDGGDMDHEMAVEDVLYIGDLMFEVTATLYRIDYSEEPDSSEYRALVGSYILRFLKADDSAYGYTLIGCRGK